VSTIFDIEAKQKLQQHYRIKEVAVMCAISEKTVYRWIYEKRIKAHRIGGSIRIPRTELLTIIQNV